ncbi:hypothetical protein [Magnetospira sp. QH-2]|uniref:hypothetical protein n=1 Tax=Magnetospira sp. (strain QH-2) TaxID=1288970 RepID=UPI0003E80AFA|nr:hypothetical protein [Magnetospira sp. QH-2]CCQ74284.1 Conserved protein of unknown function [Magnetospira sp. QH-2]
MSRKFNWFGYLNGDDLREACAAGGPEVYRFVYNGDYANQVRTYDLAVQPDGGGKLSIHVFGPAEVARISVEKGLDLIAPWKGQSALVNLRPEDITRLRAAWDPSSAPEGLEMSSERFYWIVGACRNGTYRFNAYLWPSKRFDSMTFDDLLFGWDFTDVKVSEPHPAVSEATERMQGVDIESRFNIRIGRNGLWTLGGGQ